MCKTYTRTPLHWACKRGHVDIVRILLGNNADKTIVAEKGETPLSLATKPEVRQLLGADGSSPEEPSLPIAPNYLKNPPLNGKVDLYPVNGMNHRKQNGTGELPHAASHPANAHLSPIEELVLKVRIANCGDPDFIEVELPTTELTYYTLLRTCCDELGLTPSQVIRIRKLPDTVIRKDKDVQRLRNFQEIEFVATGSNGMSKSLSSGILFPGSATPNGYQSIHLYKNQTILY
ncbi:ankyrin repeat domain-containing protein 40-like isoform X2 [Macrosteles quadrilineatus]|uniref:ankyrin repeat domain-containing protein 40-like isoform X2 n=1 Tax=Macrosteles quadrilineatus TaxID=74068 RepID=UPI0023E10ED2|nr:ankyrin repeat domain-containing protein 40-like isoform X2 [Macrosteles quadrilineatus]XP_054284578.1 ankyrin repeat domain-containing protein 40-like isoform X2 [Macrosteles quadrilineatus]